MEILVCIKQVPGTNKVEVDPETGVLKRDGVDSKMNPYDLYAIETALRLREQHGGRVRALSMGPPQAEAVIREAWALGVDEGVLLTDRRFGGADVLATSYALSQGIRSMGEFDLILCGKQTTDGDTAQVGPEIAEYLDIPSVSGVRRILSVEAGRVTVEMDMLQDVEISRLQTPCLLCVEKDIYQPRLPSYRRKTARQRDPVPRLTLEDMEDTREELYGLTGSPTRVVRIFPPETGGKQEILRGTGEELAGRLYDKLMELKY